MAINIFRFLSVEPGHSGSNDLRVGPKISNFLYLYSVEGAGGIPVGAGTENRVGDHDIGSTDRLVYLCFAIAR